LSRPVLSLQSTGRLLRRNASLTNPRGEQLITQGDKYTDEGNPRKSRHQADHGCVAG
jgi:hypothetical protein